MKGASMLVLFACVIVLSQTISSETINNGFHFPQCWTLFTQKLQYIDLTPLTNQLGYSVNPTVGNYTFNLNFCASAGQTCHGYNTWLVAKSKQTTSECINLAGDSIFQNFQIGQWFSKENENLGSVLTYFDGEMQNNKPRFSQIYVKCNSSLPASAPVDIIYWGQYEFASNITYKFETESPHGCTKDTQVIAILVGVAFLTLVLCCCCIIICVACCAGCGYYCCFRRKDYHQLY